MTATALGRPARHLGAVGSTMDEAAAWAAEGAPHGALVVAEHQSAGRGRHGRRWASGPSRSLLFTLVLRPGLGADRLGLVPLAAGLAVAEAAGAFGVEARLKWPNDVRVEGRKLAGVLAETAWARGRPRVLLGVGLNVAQSAFPDGLEATSLRLEAGRPVGRLEPLDPVLGALGHRLAQAEASPAALLEAIEARLERPDGPVEVRDPATGRRVARGVVLGLAPDGALRLEAEAGETSVYAGEVTLS